MFRAVASLKTGMSYVWYFHKYFFNGKTIGNGVCFLNSYVYLADGTSNVEFITLAI